MDEFDDNHNLTGGNHRHMYEGRINFSMIDNHNKKSFLEAIVHYSTKRFNEKLCYDPVYPSKLLSHLGLSADDLLTFFDEETVAMFERFVAVARLSRKEIPLPPEALGLAENKNHCLFKSRSRIENTVLAIAKNTFMSSETDLLQLENLYTVFKALSIKATFLETKIEKTKRYHSNGFYQNVFNFRSCHTSGNDNNQNLSTSRMIANNNVTSDIFGQDNLTIRVRHEFNDKKKYPDQESLFLPTIAEDNINGFIVYLLNQVFKWTPSKEHFITNEDGGKFDYPPLIKHIKSQFGNIHRFYNAAYSDEAAAIRYMSQYHFDWDHPINERYIRSGLVVTGESLQINYFWASTAVAGLGNVKLKKGRKVFWQLKVDGKKDFTSIMFGIASENSNIWNCNVLTDIIGMDNLSWGINHRGYAIHNGIKKGVTKSFPQKWVSEHVGLLFNGFGEYGTLTYFLRGQNMGVIFDNIPLDTIYYPVVASTGQLTEFKITKCLRSRVAVPKLKKIVRTKILDFICTPANINDLFLPNYDRKVLQRMWDESELLHDLINEHTHHYPNLGQ
uniref:SPRY domain-containing protein n=1 Tax=Strongyloides stercoralis TaxID=6248 RepID=A0A0K0ES19_STRER